MKKKVLVADDNEVIRFLLENYLAAHFEVSTCPDGIALLENLKRGELPDAIIADVNMPNMDGWELLQNLKTSMLLRNIPVIILSGLEKSQERVRFLKSGASDFLTKPFNPEELLIKIQNLTLKH
ncbi:MAG: response regulator [Bacteroidetes bacterium]|nr:MAG: response regulator [Bacteroidota bacterium]